MLLNMWSVFLFIIGACESAKILHVMPFTARSHYNAQKELPLELARRGHDVWVITAYLEESAPPNYHQIKIECVSFWTKLFVEKINVFSMVDLSFFQFLSLLLESGYVFSEFVFETPDVQKFLDEDHKFDVVINEVFFQESMYMLAHKYQAPLILLTTFGNSFKTNYYSRNPLQLSTVYHEYGISVDPLSFAGRLRNLYFCLTDWFWVNYIYLPRQEQYSLKYIKNLPEPVPSLKELTEKAALVLLNSHYSIDTPTAYLPKFIEVGGLHLKESNTTLPKDLQKILDEARNGVVYLSFGSNVQSSDLSEDRLQAFLKVFGELKQTVLMKWEGDELQNLPKNVIIKNWFPQREVLAHPNIQLFISHGGLLGLHEAVSLGVPIIGVPVFGDQFLNILQVVENGYGELLEYRDITEHRLRELVNKILSNPRYMKQAKEVSKRFKDRPMKALSTAVWWIEYVIRHNGADFMQTPALKLNFFEYYMIDVYLFLIIVCTFPLYFFHRLLRAVYILFFKKNTKKLKKH